jgi:nucleotide-binding universal stress UspA family protein
MVFLEINMIPEIKKVLYATDLSENARYAFGYAISIADRYDAKITILHVLEELQADKTSIVAHVIGEERWKDLKILNEHKVIEAIKVRLEKFCDELDSKTLKCRLFTDEMIVKIGHPANEILNEANNAPYDMVIMGTHGMGILEEVVMGSTARRVVRRCNKPVLTIRLP